VPQKVVSTCCQQPASVQLMAQPFALAARILLYKGATLCEDSTSSMSLAESLLQQLQQSDLLQHLAAAMAHTTHRIWELQSQLDAVLLSANLADPAYDHKQVFGPSSSSLQQLHLQASQLCACVKHLQRQLAAFNSRNANVRWHELLLPVAVPALELSVLTVQHVSTCLELLPKRLVLPPCSLWRALSLACDVINQYGVWCCATCSCCAGLHQQMLQSLYFLPADCIALLAAVYGTLICNDARAWWEAAASSSSSSQQQRDPDQKRQARWERAAWELACSRHDALPASHYLLLQLAGCSSKALLWAATDGYDNADEDLSTAAEIHSSAAHEHHLSSRIQRDFSSPNLVPETSAALLRHAVLLHWAWHYQQDNQGLMEMSRLLHHVHGSATRLTVVATTRASQASNQKLREIQQQQEQQQQSGQYQKLVLSQGPSGLFFPAPVYLQLLDDMLLLVNKLLTLLPSVAAEQQAALASSSSSGGGGSASKGTSSRPSHASASGPSPQELSSVFTTILNIGINSLLQSLITLSSSTLTEYAGLQPQQQSSSPRSSLVCCPLVRTLREDAAIWFQHAAHMCQVLEAYVREAARSHASGSAGANCPVPAGAKELGGAVADLINPTEQGLHGPLLQAAAAAGPGSREQQQLLGLLRSTIKWAGRLGPEQQGLAEQLRAAVGVAAANMLLPACRSKEFGSPATSSGALATTPEEGDGASCRAAAGGNGHQQRGSCEQPIQHSNRVLATAPSSTAAATVVPHLPWLGVLGCCCLQWSQQLGRLPTDNSAAAAAAAQSQLPPNAENGVISILPTHLRTVWGTAMEGMRGDKPLVLLCLEVIAHWLAFEDNWPELEAHSCSNVEVIANATIGCFSACKAVQVSVQEHPDAPIPLAGYVQQLSALGEALCSVAHKQSCNNPTCSNVLGPSELQLIKGRSNTCSGCRTARYCSPLCMRQHWKQHRPIWGSVERAAAAAPAAPAETSATGAKAGSDASSGP
jgi:hypothetical protein